jgi:hypothetical protein
VKNWTTNTNVWLSNKTTVFCGFVLERSDLCAKEKVSILHWNIKTWCKTRLKNTLYKRGTFQLLSEHCCCNLFFGGIVFWEENLTNVKMIRRKRKQIGWTKIQKYKFLSSESDLKKLTSQHWSGQQRKKIKTY